MKRNVLALMLALALSLGLVASPALGEKSIDNLFPASDAVFTLPNAESFLGASAETGALNLTDGFAWSYAMYDSTAGDSLERYQARLVELGYQETQSEQEGVTIWVYALDGTPALTVLATDGYVAICRRGDLSYREEETARTEGGKLIDDLFPDKTEAPKETKVPEAVELGFAIVEVKGVEMTLRQEGVATLAEEFVRHDDGPSGYETISAYTADFCWYDEHDEKMGTLRIQIWVKALEGDHFTTETDAVNGWFYNELYYSGKGFSGAAGANDDYDSDYNSFPYGYSSYYQSKSYPYGSEYTIDITNVSADKTVYEGTFSGYLTDDFSSNGLFDSGVESSPFYLTNGQFRMIVDPVD